MGGAQLDHPRGAPEPTRFDLAHACVVLAAIALVVLVSGVLAQLAEPFIRRDDWPALLPPGTPGTADPLGKVRGEGRWLDYGWWWLIGQHGTPDDLRRRDVHGLGVMSRACGACSGSPVSLRVDCSPPP